MMTMKGIANRLWIMRKYVVLQMCRGFMLFSAVECVVMALSHTFSLMPFLFAIGWLGFTLAVDIITQKGLVVWRKDETISCLWKEVSCFGESIFFLSLVFAYGTIPRSLFLPIFSFGMIALLYISDSRWFRYVISAWVNALSDLLHLRAPRFGFRKIRSEGVTLEVHPLTEPGPDGRTDEENQILNEMLCSYLDNDDRSNPEMAERKWKEVTIFYSRLKTLSESLMVAYLLYRNFNEILMQTLYTFPSLLEKFPSLLFLTS